jgi:transcriptional regulator with XRE-family HTH domain
MRRVELGMNQTALAQRLGVAFQQVQKYEKGQNRISAGRMPPVADALDVPIGYFYGHDDAAAGVDSTVIADSIGLLTERPPSIAYGRRGRVFLGGLGGGVLEAGLGAAAGSDGAVTGLRRRTPG